MRPKIAIIIVNWNGKDDTMQCLQSLDSFCSRKGQFGVFVVDNGSSDGSPAAIREQFGSMQSHGWRELVLLEQGANLGFAAANNRGLEAVGDEYNYVYCSNNDIVFVEDAPGRLADIMERHPDVAVAGPRILEFADPEKLAHGAGHVRPLLCGTRSVDAPGPADCDFVTGCALLIRMTVLRELDTFIDEDFFAYWEDTDLCARVRRKGHRVVYYPETRVLHKVSATTSPGEAGLTSPRRIYYDIHSKCLYANKHLGWLARTLFLLLFLVRIPVFASQAVLRAPRTAVPRVAAYLEGLRDGLTGRRGKEFAA